MFSSEPFFERKATTDIPARSFRQTCEKFVKNSLPLSTCEPAYFSDFFEFSVEWQSFPHRGWVVCMFACWKPERVHGWPDSMQPTKYRKLVASCYPRKTYDSAYRLMCSL